ncbi:MAG: hypothetical protein KBS79_06300, partial [Lachnospiraceae bacterium]|nr:hypothetical protein [Candidatus Minthocola equi]
LVYFPTIRLIESFNGFLRSLRPDIYEFTACYNGGMNADCKKESFEEFKKGDNKLVMLATKAFGMGIDIHDIDCVLHYAPTGNVCDYMQEIGRAARDEAIQGTAVYRYMKDDFRYINQLHGMSTIKSYQLVQVMNKLLELHERNLKKYGGRLFKKRNEMLVDADSFKHIFSSGDAENDTELINKVKTAMLIIQKDFEPRGYAPFYIKPVPLFSKGYFQIAEAEKRKLEERYPGVLKLVNASLDIYEVDLNRIWEYSYKNKMSFPKFKFELYTNDKNADFNKRYKLIPTLSIDLELKLMEDSQYYGMINPIVNMVKDSQVKNEFISLGEMITKLKNSVKISDIKAKSILNVLLDAMNQYSRKYAHSIGNPVYNVRMLRNEKLPEEERIKYKFNTLAYRFFEWLMLGYEKVAKDGENGKLYVVNDFERKASGAILTVLGVLEAFDMLTFSSLGGSNSPIYIYVNETIDLEKVRANPNSYRNRLLNLVGERHRTSVAVLKHIFESGYTSDEIWELLENYFLGIVPEGLESELHT